MTTPTTTTLREFSLCWPEKPTLLNAERAGNRYARAATTSAWRDAFWALARQQHIPPLGPCAIEVLHECRTKRLPDCGACVPSAKAAIDGIRDAGVWPDDTPAWVRQLIFTTPVTTGRDALTIVIREIEPRD